VTSEAPFPVLAPVGDPAPPGARRAPAARWTALLAALLGLVVAASAVLSVVLPPASPPTAPWLFPSEAHARVEALRDRLASGLLTLQRRDGLFTAQPDGAFSDDTLDDTVATARAGAGLAVARRMGSRVPGLEEGLSRARASLLVRQRPDGGFGQSAKPGRGATVVAVAAAILALSLDDDPRAGPAVELAGRRLVDVSTLGPLPGGWVQAATVRAFWQLVEDARTAVLGGQPLAVVPTRDVGTQRDAGEARISEAFAQTLRVHFGGASALPGEIVAKVLADPPRWDGPRTDVSTWLLAAWLCARVPGGEAWYPVALTELERAVGPDGTVPWDAYGSPTSKTATGLLILWEGSGLRRLPPS
jgi:hypothetical protein